MRIFRSWEHLLIKWLKLTKSHNLWLKAVKCDLGIICTFSGHGNNNWKASSKSLKTGGGVAETRLTDEKLLKGHNSGKNHSSITSIKICASSGHGNNN